jgi:hypothetical protein
MLLLTERGYSGNKDEYCPACQNHFHERVRIGFYQAAGIDDSDNLLSKPVHNEELPTKAREVLDI